MFVRRVRHPYHSICVFQEAAREAASETGSRFKLQLQFRTEQVWDRAKSEGSREDVREELEKRNCIAKRTTREPKISLDKRHRPPAGAHQRVLMHTGLIDLNSHATELAVFFPAPSFLPRANSKNYQKARTCTHRVARPSWRVFGSLSKFLIRSRGAGKVARQESRDCDSDQVSNIDGLTRELE